MSAMRKCAQPRLRVRRLMKMPPRLKPITAPSNAAVNMLPGEEPPVPRIKRTECVPLPKSRRLTASTYWFPPREIVSQTNSKVVSLDLWCHSASCVGVLTQTVSFFRRRVTLVTNTRGQGCNRIRQRYAEGTSRNASCRKEP
jgi:hypothetical protein